jgi:uncharacterized protein
MTSKRIMTFTSVAVAAACLLMVGAAYRRDSLNASLIDAVVSRDYARMKRLLDQGADPHCWTKTHVERSNFGRFLDWLFGRTRDPSYTLSPNVPILSIAAQDSDPRSAQMLLDAGADCNIKDLAGNTPLIYAAPGARDTAALLIQRGADVNARGYNGATALLRAVERSNHYPRPGPDPAMIELLLAHGADPTMRDGNGHWPAGQAVAHRHAEAARLLNRAAARQRAGHAP